MTTWPVTNTRLVRAFFLTAVSVVIWRSVTYNGRVVSGTGLVDDSVETVVVISSVSNFTGRAIGFDQTVFTLNDISVPFFPLVLDVTGVVVLHAIVERILGRRLFNIENTRRTNVINTILY